MRPKIYLLSGLLLISSLVSYLRAQDKTNDLQNLSRQFELQQSAAKTEAVAKAKQLGIPVSMQGADGSFAELQSFVGGQPRYNLTSNLEGAGTIHSSAVWPGGTAGLSLSGQGQTLGIWDGGGVRTTHQEFGGRVTQVDNPSSLNWHSTHVAGTMMAAGVVTNAKGMSFQANLDAYEWNSDLAEMTSAAANGLLVSQHSYGFITGWYNNGSAWYWYGWLPYSTDEDYGFGYYSEDARDWDILAYNAPNYLIVKSAGNDRGEGPAPGTQHYVWDNGSWQLSTAVRQLDGGPDGYDCVQYRGNAKNILTVGAVTASGAMSSFSGWGPTDDGRIKPDIVAKGVNVYSTNSTNNTSYTTASGTSMAGPMVSGSIGLIQQHHQNLYGAPMKSASVKAVLFQTATDLGNPGPDYQYGWGLMNTEAAALLMSADVDAGENFNIRELSLANGETKNIQLVSDGSPLKATICWTDPAGTSPTPSLNPTDLMLVNDLDMQITDANSTVFQPYVLDPANPSAAATTGDNFRDNVEQILIANPAGGQTYTLTITHKGTLAGPQDFTLVVSGISAVAAPMVFNLTGGGSYCALQNPSGVDINLSGSETGVSYQLKRGGQNVGAAIIGDGNAIQWTDQTAGSYTVEASNGNSSIAMNGTVVITEEPALDASVTIVADASSLCAGETAVFTATAINEGTTPSYQWSVNSNPAGTNSPTFSYQPANGDQVRVELTSSLSCLNNNPVFSNVITMQVASQLTATVSIQADATSVCAGSTVSFTSSQTNGGSSPVYQWFVNGAPSGSNLPSYSYQPDDGDVVQLQMTSSAGCVAVNPVMSNTLILNVNPLLEATVSIQADQTTVCEGTTVSFSASSTNGGANPGYDWLLNGISTGIATPTYSYAPDNGDVVQLELTSSAECLLSNPVLSNQISLAVTPTVEASVTIEASATAVCEGTVVSFTSTQTNGGSNPAYQWLVNGSAAGANTPTFSYVPADGDEVSLQLTSNANCVSNPVVLSNIVTITVQEPLVVAVSIAANSTDVCEGEEVQFTSSATNAGVSPVYQWTVNGTPSGGNTATFSYFPADGDLVQLQLTSSEGCVVSATVLSNEIALTVSTAIEATAVIESVEEMVCTGETMHFTATTSGGGVNPTYSWKVNGTNTGTNAPTFSYVPQDGDQVQLLFVSGAACVTNNPVLSNVIDAQVNEIPAVSWENFDPATICIFWDPILLSGGLPQGGTYSGAGVVDNVFYPATAGVGSHVLTYAYTSPEGCSDEATFTVFVDVCAGIQEQHEISDLTIFPNPASSELNLSFGDEIVKLKSLEILNLMGEKLLSILNTEAKSQYRYDVSNLKPGLYLMRITTEKASYCATFVVKTK